MAIHVTLFHNPKAGFEQSSKEELLSALQMKGYNATYINIQEDYLHILQNPGDLVVIAGGDGTIKKIASKLIGKGIPIGLLPMGTANNIATSLRIAGKPADIIGAWDLSRRKSFSLGMVKGPGGESFFLESAGFGMLPRLIRQHMSDKENKTRREEELEDALRHQQQILKEYKAHSCTIKLDGQQVSGNYILVEVMNIRLAGPNLDLAPDAKPEDGFLDVVLIREEEREKFSTYLNNRIKGKANQSQLPVRKAEKIQVEWHGIHYHLDDDALENSSPIKMDIRVRSKGLEFLAV